MTTIFARLGFSEQEELALLKEAEAAYRYGEALPGPSQQQSERKAKWKKAQQCAEKLLRALESVPPGCPLPAEARRRLENLRLALKDLPTEVVRVIECGRVPGSGEYFWEPGGDPLARLADPGSDAPALRAAAEELMRFELSFNAHGVTSVDDPHDTIHTRPLKHPQRRDWGVNRLILLVALVYHARTGRPPTVSARSTLVDDPVDVVEQHTREGDFADLLREVVRRLPLGLCPDTVVRKAVYLRESGSLG